MLHRAGPSPALPGPGPTLRLSTPCSDPTVAPAAGLARNVSPDSLADSLDLLPAAPSVLRALAGILPLQQVRPGGNAPPPT